MDPLYWGILAGVVLLAVALGASIMWFVQRRRRAKQLRERFGPEYDRLVETSGDHAHAEEELMRREERVRQYDIHPLSKREQERYTESWREVQAAFVDEPAASVDRADELVTEVMKRRGYPMSEFEERAADLSVDHPNVIENYREGHALAERSRRGEASTEDLRQAMVHYRALFEDLLERRIAGGTTTSEAAEDEATPATSKPNRGAGT